MERHVVSIQVPLDFEFLLTNAGCFVPIQLSASNRSIRQSNPCHARALAPPAMTVLLAEAPQFTDLPADGERLDIADLAEDREIHAPSSLTRL